MTSQVDCILAKLPRSKSNINNCTILSIIYNDNSLLQFLEKRLNELSDDELASYFILKYRNFHIVLNNRSLKIRLIELDKKLGIEIPFIEGEQLRSRELDVNSSQWSSAKLLCGYEVNDNRYHVELTRKTIERWNKGERDSLFESLDDNYLRLFKYYFDNVPFVVDNPEIAVWAVCLGYMKLEEAIELFPTWKHHEEDRTKAIKKAIQQLVNGELITTQDHRIYVGIYLRAKWLGIKAKFAHPECVNKSMPKFKELFN